MALTERDIALRHRHNCIIRAFGCRREDAWEIERGKSGFSKAANHFGPMFCWYRKDAYQWTLFGQPRSKKQIVAAAGLPAGRYGRRGGKWA